MSGVDIKPWLKGDRVNLYYAPPISTHHKTSEQRVPVGVNLTSLHHSLPAYVHVSL